MPTIKTSQYVTPDQQLALRQARDLIIRSRVSFEWTFLLATVPRLKDETEFELMTSMDAELDKQRHSSASSDLERLLQIEEATISRGRGSWEWRQLLVDIPRFRDETNGVLQASIVESQAKDRRDSWSIRERYPAKSARWHYLEIGGLSG